MVSELKVLLGLIFLQVMWAASKLASRANKKGATCRDVPSTPLAHSTHPIFHESSRVVAYGSSSLSISSILQNHSIVSLTSISLSVKLNEHNYLLWREQIVRYIIVFGLDNLIDPLIPIQPQFLSSTRIIFNPAFIQWKHMNSILKS